MKKQLFLLIIATTFCLIGNSQTPKPCTVTCYIPATHGRVCPNSITWRQAADIYDDPSAAAQIGYVKDARGCWVLSGSSTKTITGSKTPLQKLYNKLKRFFSTSKTGF